MNRFLTFLGEAFPPPKKPPFGGGKKPAFGQQSKPAPVIKQEDDEIGPEEGEEKTGEFDQQDGMQNGTDALVAMQQAQQEKEQQELQMRQQKQAEEDAERNAIKKMRASADAEVSAALEDKYNADDDSVEFYPEILTFGQFTKDGKQDAGGPGQQSGKGGTAPGDDAPENAGSEGKLKRSAKDQDERQDEEDSTDPNPDESDDEDVESQRQKRQKDAEQGDEAKKSNKQQKKW